MAETSEHCDVLVVGAGASGGVVAARLSEDANRRVMLIDAGPDFADEADVPPLFTISGEHSWRVSGLPEFDWNFYDRDKAGRRGGRPIRLPRGRLVGGSSMVNSTIAVRPAPFDFDRWAALGCTGWDWQSVLPYFIRIETDRDFGAEPAHGDRGPIVIQRYRPEHWAPVNTVFAEACDVLGVVHAADLNGADGHVGVFGPFPHNRYKEVRLGTLVTYIRAARRRPNLVIRGSRIVDRVIVSNGRATGVTWFGREGHGTISADTIVLAAGVYNTPAVLQRSGIGPADLLRRLGIPIVRDAGAVGRSLSDHPGCAFFFKADGIAATTGRLFAVNWRGTAGEAGEPWWQTHPFPADEEDGLCGLFTYLCRQEASGTVVITAPDPGTPPEIDHNYLAGQEDVRRFADALDALRALLATPPFAARGARLVDPVANLPAYLAANLVTAHHQGGTCAMGPDPDRAVVDPRLSVHGLDGLKIADSSIFPDTVMHNTNLSCYVIGEIAADIIAGRR